MDGKFEISFKTPANVDACPPINVIYLQLSNQFGKCFITYIKVHSNSGFLYFGPKSKVSQCQLDMIKVSLEAATVTDNFTPSQDYPGYYLCSLGGHFKPLTHYEILIDATCLLHEDTNSKKPANDNGANNYHEGLLESGKFSDVLIKTADDKEIKAHSMMLSRSRVFDAMLNIHDTKEAREKIIKIDDVDHDLMKEFLRFIYCEKCPKLAEMAKDLLALADRYEIPELVKVCGAHMIEKEDIESIAEILIPADNMKIQDLKESVIQFATRKRKLVTDTAGWKRLKLSHCSLALEVTEKFFKE